MTKHVVTQAFTATDLDDKQEKFEPGDYVISHGGSGPGMTRFQRFRTDSPESRIYLLSWNEFLTATRHVLD